MLPGRDYCTYVVHHQPQAGLRGTAGERMFAAGLYPGVDYAIEEAAIAPDARGRAEEERLSLTVRPIYPLIPKLEREWPITVPYEMAPRYSPNPNPNPNPSPYPNLTRRDGTSVG